MTRDKLMAVFKTLGRVWDAGPGLGQKWLWAPGERRTDGGGTRLAYMCKHTLANMGAK